jgi:hypothetical protein
MGSVMSGKSIKPTIKHFIEKSILSGLNSKQMTKLSDQEQLYSIQPGAFKCMKFEALRVKMLNFNPKLVSLHNSSIRL